TFKESSIKKFSFFLFTLILVSGVALGQTIGFTVYPVATIGPISPYTYGSNGSIPLVNNIPLYRQGGNRMTAYNWENNASNAGTDYGPNHEDWYMLSVMGLPQNGNQMPATTLTTFILGNNAVSAASLVTLQ